MPIWTNRHNIHPAIAGAIEFDPWQRRGDITVTQLTRPPLMAWLEQTHDHELQIDVGDRLWALLGQLAHELMRRQHLDSALQEEPLSMIVDDWEVTGRPDLWEEPGDLSDFKVTSVWSFVFGDKPDWEMQLNFYAALYRHAGLPVNSAKVIAILRDWQKNRSGQDDNYPPIPYAEMTIPLWPEDVCLERLRERVAMHRVARAGRPRPCTDAERWAKPDQWAVMKRGQKRAVKLFSNEAGAETLAADKGNGLYVEHRPGDKWVRCASYCDVASFCGFYRDGSQNTSVPVAE